MKKDLKIIEKLLEARFVPFSRNKVSNYEQIRISTGGPSYVDFFFKDGELFKIGDTPNAKYFEPIPF